MLLSEQIAKKLEESNDKLVKRLLKESIDKDLYKKFIIFCKQEIEKTKSISIKKYPKVILTNDKSKTQTLGHNDLTSNEIVVYCKGRLTADILRTLAHELVHSAQMIAGEITKDSGSDGSPQENEANSLAGIILRKFGRSNPEIYDVAEETGKKVVYRKIVCPKVDYNNLGVHTSEDLDYVNSYDPEVEAPEYKKNSNEKTYILHISVSTDQINQKATQQSNQSHPDEKEVVLLPKQEVSVKSFVDGQLVYKGIANTGDRCDDWAKENLNEIGEGNSSYPFELLNTKQQGKNIVSYYYGFQTETGLDYQTYFEERFWKKYTEHRIGFGLDKVQADEMTNEGKPLKIVSTVTNIIKDYISSLRSEDLNKSVFSYNSTLKLKNGVKTDQRGKIYIQFLQKHLPGDFTFKNDGNEYYFFRNTEYNNQIVDDLINDNNSLMESGDSTSSYKYKEIEQTQDKKGEVNSISYQFVPSKGLKYIVSFVNSMGEWDIAYSANGSYDVVTNKGDARMIISTVMTIIQQFFTTYPDIAKRDTFCLTGIFKKGEDVKGVSKRSKIYYQYCKQRFSSLYDVQLSGNDVILSFKNKTLKTNESKYQKLLNRKYPTDELREEADKAITDKINNLVDKKYEFGCLMLDVPYKNWSNFIHSYLKPEDMYPSEGQNGYSEESHVTVSYGFGDDVNIDVIKKYVDEHFRLGVNVWLKDISIFENDKFDVVKFKVECPEIEKMHNWIENTFNITSDYPTYEPHLTIGWVNKGMGSKYVKKLKGTPYPRILCTEFTYSGSDKSKTNLQIKQESTKFENTLFTSYLQTIEGALKSKK